MPAFTPLARLSSPRSASVALGIAAVLSGGGAWAQAAPPAPSPPASEPQAPGAPSVLPPRPDPVTVDVGVRFGGVYRFGDAPAYSITGRGGPLLGVGVGIAPSTRFSIGLAYEHAGLGSEHGEGDLGVVDLDRTIDTLWANLRLSLFRTDRFGLDVLLGPGLVWQSVTADVIAYGNDGWRPDAYRCKETGGPGLGLRAGLGGEVTLGGGFFLTLDALLDELRLGDGPLGDCAPGAGSTALFGVRGGLAYRIDVTRFVR